MSDPLLQVLTKGLQENLSETEIIEGMLRFTTDTGRLYLDLENDNRVPITNVVLGYTESEILALQNPLDKVYVASDSLKIFTSDGTNIRDISEIIPVVTTSNEDMYLWLSGTNDKAPKYNTALKFNPYTKQIQLGGVQITKTILNGESTLDFSIV